MPIIANTDTDINGLKSSRHRKNAADIATDKSYYFRRDRHPNQSVVAAATTLSHQKHP